MVLSGDGAPKKSEQRLDNDNGTYLVLASGKLAQKKIFIRPQPPFSPARAYPIKFAIVKPNVTLLKWIWDFDKPSTNFIEAKANWQKRFRRRRRWHRTRPRTDSRPTGPPSYPGWTWHLKCCRKLKTLLGKMFLRRVKKLSPDSFIEGFLKDFLPKVTMRQLQWTLLA